MLFTIRNKGLSNRRKPLRCVLTLFLAATALVGFGSGLHRRNDSQDPIVNIAHLPAFIDAVVVIEGASSLRTLDTGATAIGALIESGLLAKTTRSWDELALSLDWTPGEAFDELLGRRVVLVLDEIQRTSGPRWVVVADVDETTQARIRKKLKLAPRTVASGARVLAGERGRFRLAVIPAEHGSDVSSLLIAPMDHTSLFFQTLEALMDTDADMARFGDTRGYRELQKLDRRPLRMVVQHATDSGASETFLAVSGECVGDEWVADWSASLDLFGLGPELAQDLLPWPWQAFDSFSDEALLAVMGITGRVQSETPGSLGRFVTGLLSVGQASSAFPDAGPVQMFAIHRTTPPSGSDADKNSSSQIGLLIAAQSAQPADAAAIDKALTKFITNVSKPTARSKLELDGAFPGAVRSVQVRPCDETTFAWLHAKGEDITISWSQTQPSDEASTGAWWMVQISGSQEARALSSRLRALGNALSGGDSVRPLARRVSMGVIKPREMADWFTELGTDTMGELAMLRDIEKIRWDAWLTDEQLIKGQARMTIRSRALPRR